MRKCTDFCYAGCWSLYLDLGTGRSKPCYGQMYNQNIFENPGNDIIFEPVGKHCRQPYCYNGHAYLALGMIPELDTPTYADIRNRKCADGSQWQQPDLNKAFSVKLYETNEIWSEKQKTSYERRYMLRTIKTASRDLPELTEKLIKVIKRK